VITEYVRSALRFRRRKFDGIRYRSSRLTAKTALVLFADQRNIVFEGPEQPDFYFLWKDRWLRLLKATQETVSQADLDRWKAAFSYIDFL